MIVTDYHPHFPGPCRADHVAQLAIVETEESEVWPSRAGRAANRMA
jgi:hypothetical protein